MREHFRKLATHISNGIGSPLTFILAFAVVISWLVIGFLFDYSDRWQLIISTATNVIALLILFIVQYTQNRDTRAIHLKLDELIKALKGARTGLVDIEDLSDADLDALQAEFKAMHEKYFTELHKRKKS